jgi:hypothetical protein
MAKFSKFFNLHPVTQFLIAVLLIAMSYSFIQIIIAVIEHYTGEIADAFVKWVIVFSISLVGLLLLGVSSKKIRKRLFR